MQNKKKTQQKNQTQELHKLIGKLKKERSMGERLVLFLQLYPNSILGVSQNDLKSKEKDKNTTSKIPTNTNCEPQKQQAKPAENDELERPKEMKIERNYLTKLSELTGRSRRTLERGISSFCYRQFGFVNIHPYSPEFLVFGKPEQCSSTNLEHFKNKKNQSNQSKDKKKKKIIVVGRKRKANNSTKSQTNTPRSPQEQNFSFNCVSNNDLKPNIPQINKPLCVKSEKQTPPNQTHILLQNPSLLNNYVPNHRKRVVSLKFSQPTNFSKLQLLSEVSQHWKQLRPNSYLSNIPKNKAQKLNQLQITQQKNLINNNSHSSLTSILKK
ncbi:hypothetical protein M0813_08717 [Anaeramoeba flamelloides]|uniref:Uncharacterized protein n=1 Tax=Anaeramoeba flamelloides TaxID=1746091 RepID=A0ABQ8X942_9EUKA|nr:hypothetical protein M0813_08717 [Anaeramoeba flamelloides]